MTLHLYGLLIGLGIVLGLLAAQKAQKKLGQANSKYLQVNLEQLWLWLFLPALVGARFYHAIDYWVFYSQNPVQVFYVWQGGLAIYGAILGGLLGLLAYTEVKKKEQLLIYTLDLLALALPLAQAMGRLGNFFNQELYGRPTSLPWGIYINPENRISQFLQSNYFHPLFAYEAILNLVLFGFLWWQVDKKRKAGFWTGVYLIGYGVIRFGLEYMRIEPWQLVFLTTAQWFSLLFIIAGIFILLKPSRHQAQL